MNLGKEYMAILCTMLQLFCKFAIVSKQKNYQKKKIKGGVNPSMNMNKGLRSPEEKANHLLVGAGKTC